MDLSSSIGPYLIKRTRMGVGKESKEAVKEEIRVGWDFHLVRDEEEEEKGGRDEL